MNVDFSGLKKVRKPSRKEKHRYRLWKKYLSDMGEEYAHKTAAAAAVEGTYPPDFDPKLNKYV